MPQAVNIDLLGRDELTALVRLAIEQGAFIGDMADVARARLVVASNRCAHMRSEWQAALAAENDARRAADDVQDDPYRRDEFAGAANQLRAASDLVRTLRQQLSRAERTVEIAQYDFDAALAERAQTERNAA